jgi:hypothetical protein
VLKSSITPFDAKFGEILKRIEKLRQEVRDEANLINAGGTEEFELEQVVDPN